MKADVKQPVETNWCLYKYRLTANGNLACEPNQNHGYKINS